MNNQPGRKTPRNCLRWLAGILFAAFALTAIAVADEKLLGGDRMEHVEIYKEEGLYSCFPELYEAETGKVLVTKFSRRETRSHMDPRGPGDKTMISRDGGLIWEAGGDEKTVVPAWRTDSGDWVRVTDEGWQEVDASERERLEAEGRRVRDVREGIVAYLTPYYRIERSSDRGQTWQSERVRAPDYVRGLFRMFETHTYMVTSEGVRMRALYGLTDESVERGDMREVFVIRSEDDGKTWDFVRLQPDGPDEIGFDETSLTELADGRLLMMMRTRPAGYLWQSFSDDQGKTWTAPEETPMWGFPGHVLVLPDGRVLCTYGYRRAPMGIRASVSHDNGKTWDVESEYILRDDGMHRGGDIGYPTSTVRADGSVFTIYYINLEDNITHIAGTIWELE